MDHTNSAAGASLSAFEATVSRPADRANSRERSDSVTGAERVTSALTGQSGRENILAEMNAEVMTDLRRAVRELEKDDWMFGPVVVR